MESPNLYGCLVLICSVSLLCILSLNVRHQDRVVTIERLETATNLVLVGWKTSKVANDDEEIMSLQGGKPTNCRHLELRVLNGIFTYYVNSTFAGKLKHASSFTYVLRRELVQCIQVL